MEDVLIEFKDVSKSFGNRTILNNINLKIYDHHVTTVIGKSGTGKSTNNTADLFLIFMHILRYRLNNNSHKFIKKCLAFLI